jgi:hypothetical protein
MGETGERRVAVANHHYGPPPLEVAMTGAEHWLEAERLVAEGEAARAQVHATLAMAWPNLFRSGPAAWVKDGADGG